VRFPSRYDTAIRFLYAFLVVACIVPRRGECQARGRSPSIASVNITKSDKPARNWRIDLAPFFRLTDEAEPELEVVTAVARLKDGSLAIACDTDIRVFSPRAERIRVMGRKGPGPGEFVGGLSEMLRKGDSLVGIGGDDRAQVFAPNGRYVRTELPPRIAQRQRATRIAYLDDGRLVVRTRVAGDSDGGPSMRSRMELWAIDAAKQERIGTFIGSELERVSTGRFRRRVFGPGSHVSVAGNRVCTAFTTSYAFECILPSGVRTLQLNRSAAEGAAVTAVDRAMYIDADARANPGELGAPQREATRLYTLFAARHPPFGRMLPSRSGEIWIGPVEPSDETVMVGAAAPVATTWSVYSPRGAWLSDIVMPAHFRLLEAGQDYVAGITTDESGATNVVMFRVHR